ncbi:glycosyltransferase [Lachnospiraceae bacterium LCP25S3_G4]
MKEQMKVDVIIPTYKPDDKFERLIKKLLLQSYPIHQIHVINTDVGRFPDEICKYGEQIEVTHIPQDAFDHGATRGMGAAGSKAEIIVFMTQDAIPANENLIKELVLPFKDELIGATYARQMPASDCKIIERYTRSFNYPKESKIKTKDDLEVLGIKTFFCSNVCAAYRKSTYIKMGGFVERTIFNEDMIMAGGMIRAGYKVGYVATAEVIHSHNYSYTQQFKRNFDLAVSQRNHPEIFKGIHSEKEGIRLVKRTMKYLVKIKKPWLIFSLVINSGFKYLGYKCGSNYMKLPQFVILKFTMNTKYWIK